MKNNIFIRIDDRLLHGQVVVSWIPYLQAHEVVVADDEYARDEFMCDLIKSSEPQGVRVHVKTIEETAEFLKEDRGERILILLRTIEGIKKLSEKVHISRVNIGGLGAGQGRERYYKSIHFSQDDLDMIKNLTDRGIDVEIRMLPKDKALEIKGN